MLILVDGYNVTRSDAVTKGLSVEAQRDRLVARLRARGNDLLGAGEIVVVFDGAAAGGSVLSAAPIEVRFSRDGQSADDLIVDLAAGASDDGLCVVTSDRELIGRVRAAASVPVMVRAGRDAYESAKAMRTHRAPSRARLSEDLGVPPGGNAITKELKAMWCAEGEDEE